VCSHSVFVLVRWLNNRRVMEVRVARVKIYMIVQVIDAWMKRLSVSSIQRWAIAQSEIRLVRVKTHAMGMSACTAFAAASVPGRELQKMSVGLRNGLVSMIVCHSCLLQALKNIHGLSVQPLTGLTVTSSGTGRYSAPNSNC